MKDLSARFQVLLGERILILDGAMGTMIQRHGLSEADYRGERFADWPRDLKGNNDLLTLTQPQVIGGIHQAYLDAGADILETNTFNANRISMADYGMEDLSRELNVAAARLARDLADAAATPDQPRFVAGVLGPTNRTLSISPDVNDPGFRNLEFPTLVAAYVEAAEGLIEGGADLLLIETIFDTLNAKAAIVACEEVFEKQGQRLPVMISGTITDQSGRTLTGQTTEAFYNSLRHVQPISIGLNCALGPYELRQYVAEMARIAETHVSAHPNAGLPNEMGGYDLGPAEMAREIAEWAEAGLLNIVGGCCGTSPDHIRAIAQAVAGKPPRRLPSLAPACRLSGLEPLNIDKALTQIDVADGKGDDKDPDDVMQHGNGNETIHAHDLLGSEVGPVKDEPRHDQERHEGVHHQPIDDLLHGIEVCLFRGVVGRLFSPEDTPCVIPDLSIYPLTKATGLGDVLPPVARDDVGDDKEDIEGGQGQPADAMDTGCQFEWHQR